MLAGELGADNLYDVFFNIREDEAQHCKTMLACQTRGNLRSPHSAMHAPTSPTAPTASQDNDSVVALLPPAECAGIIECATTSSSFVERARRKGLEVKLDHPPQQCRKP